MLVLDKKDGATLVTKILFQLKEDGDIIRGIIMDTKDIIKVVQVPELMQLNPKSGLIQGVAM